MEDVLAVAGEDRVIGVEWKNEVVAVVDVDLGGVGQCRRADLAHDVVTAAEEHDDVRDGGAARHRVLGDLRAAAPRVDRVGVVVDDLERRSRVQPEVVAEDRAVDGHGVARARGLRVGERAGRRCEAEHDREGDQKGRATSGHPASSVTRVDTEDTPRRGFIPTPGGRAEARLQRIGL